MIIVLLEAWTNIANTTAFKLESVFVKLEMG